MKWEPLGQGKGDREGRGGGRSVHKQPGTRADGIAPHAKEGFQESKKGSGTGEGFSRQGDYQGDCAMCLRYNANLVHIVPIVCMSCL